MLTFSYEKLRKSAFVILGLPFIVFAIGWLKWYWAIVAVIATIVCIYVGAFYKKTATPADEQERKQLEIHMKKGILLLLIAIAMIWVWQSGIGGFWAQSKDYPWRNAIFRDIVLRDWPVYYEMYDGALCYYIAFWLVPALAGKLALLMGANDVVAFQVASVAIYIWSVVLIVNLFLLLITLFRANTSKRQLFVLLGFVFFSGLDILGSIEPLGANLYHLEWWANLYQYSSFSTCLFWVFNQSIIPWMAFACLLQEKTVHNYVFLGMMCLFSGPLPFIGFFIFCISLGVIKALEAIKMKKGKDYIKAMISVSNVVAVLFIFIFVGSYLLSNSAIAGGGTLRLEENVAIADVSVQSAGANNEISLNSLLNYIKFVMFEFGFYALLVMRKNYKNPLFYVTVACLLLFPFLKIGNGYDFPMRASIPALFYIYYLVIKFFLEEKKLLNRKGEINRTLYIVLIVVFLLGSVTPAVEFYRGCRQVVLNGLDNPLEDYLYTLGGDGPMDGGEETGRRFSNFVALNPKEQPFFEYFSKELY